MTDPSLVSLALGLVLQVAGPCLAVLLLAGVLAGFLKTLFSMDDEMVSLVFKLTAILALGYLWGPSIWKEMAEFTLSLWGSPDFYLWGSVLYFSLGMALGLLFLSFGFLPLFLSLSFFFVSCLFFGPSFYSSPSLLVSEEALLAALEFSPENFLFFLKGILSSLALTLSAYFAHLLGSWGSSLISKKEVRNSEWQESVYTLVLLSFLVVIFSSNLPFQLFAQGLSNLAARPLSQLSLIESLSSSVGSIFSFCLFLSLPIFLASLVADLLTGALDSFFSDCLDSGIVGSIRFCMLSFCLAVSYPVFVSLLASAVQSLGSSGLFFN